VCNPDRGNKAWRIVEHQAKRLLPPPAHAWLARATELHEQANRLASLGDSSAAAQLRCQAALLRGQADALLAQNVAAILKAPQGPWLYREYLKHTIQHGRAVQFAGYVHPAEMANEAQTLLLFMMGELAVRYGHPELCRLFDELYTLWRNYPWQSDHNLDGLGELNYSALRKWACRWHLLAPDGHVPDWVLAQVKATFRLWQAMAQRKAWILRCWPIIVSDFYGWPALGPSEQQRAEEFLWQHPSFCPLTARNRDEWRLHRQFARAAGMRIAPRIPLAHFVWTCRYQFGLERACDIADSPGFGLPEDATRGRYTRQDIFHAIRRTLAMVGLVRRREKPGPRAG
jgi:hypothetical protein